MLYKNAFEFCGFVKLGDTSYQETKQDKTCRTFCNISMIVIFQRNQTSMGHHLPYQGCILDKTEYHHDIKH